MGINGAPTTLRKEKATINTEISAPITLNGSRADQGHREGGKQICRPPGRPVCRMPRKTMPGRRSCTHDVAVRSTWSRVRVLENLLVRPRIDMAGGASTATILFPESRRHPARTAPRRFHRHYRSKCESPARMIRRGALMAPVASIAAAARNMKRHGPVNGKILTG